MNPALIRELDAEGGAILQLLDDLPLGSKRDMSGHLDGKRTIATRLAKLMKRWREAGAGTAPTRPADLFPGPAEIKRQRPRHVVVRGAR